MAKRLSDSLICFKGLDSIETLEMIANILRVKALEVVSPTDINIGWDLIYQKLSDYEKVNGETIETAMIKQALSILVWLNSVQKEE
jgi:hypothetical protein